MSEDSPQTPPTAPYQVSPEDLAQMLAAGVPGAGAPSGGLPIRGSLRRKLFIAVLIAAIGVGASIMSCVGQSFSYRQARALEGIEHQLRGLYENCTAPREVPEAGR